MVNFPRRNKTHTLLNGWILCTQWPSATCKKFSTHKEKLPTPVIVNNHSNLAYSPTLFWSIQFFYFFFWAPTINAKSYSYQNFSHTSTLQHWGFDSTELDLGPEDMYLAMQKLKNGYVNDLKPGNKVTLITNILSDITQFLLLNF